MREIKFRGQTASGNLVYGNLSVLNTGIGDLVTAGTYISNSAGAPFAYEVNPATVGQFTGLHDKNGKEIYEGDIMPVYENGEEYTYKVLYDGDCFMLGFIDSEQGSYPLSTKCNISEIFGNIHDNHELIKYNN